MRKFKKPDTGDIFYLKFKDKYLIGKILFSVESQYDKIKKKKASKESENYLDDVPKNTCLIEMYSGLNTGYTVSDQKNILIKRVWVTLDGLEDVHWGIIKNEKVDFQKIEFPETLVMTSEGKKSFALLEKGELRYQTGITEDQYEKYGFTDFITDISVIPYICLNMMNKSSLIDEDEDYLRDETIENTDLLYHPDIRKIIFEQAKLDLNKSYYELAKNEGKDLARFYV